MILILTTLAVSSACTGLSSSAPDPDALAVRFDCGGKRLDVVFQRALEQAEVSVDGAAALILPQQRAASGFWYAASGYALRGKGWEADWSAPGQPRLACRALD